MVEAASRYHLYDAQNEFVEDDTITATENLGPDKILTVGDGRIDGDLILDIETIKISAGDESYNFYVQGSNDAAFASGIENLAAVDMGHSSTRDGGADGSSLVGRFKIPVTNEVNGVEYKYMRVRLVIAGTSPSIKLTSWLAKRN